MFDLSGASEREVTRWTNTDAGTLNFDNEIDYLIQWISTRMEYLDNMWDIASLPETPLGVESIEKESIIESIGVGRNGVVIKCNSATQISIYNTTGQLVKSVMLKQGVNDIPLSKGIYIVNNKKIVIL